MEKHFTQFHVSDSHVNVTNRVEEAGSVVCLCMRCVRRRKCSLMESWTSVGMSGDVWLIFTAASRKPIEPMGSFTFSVAMATGGCWGLDSRTGGWSGQCSGPQAGVWAALGKWALVRQGTQHSFQEMNVRMPNRASPQTTNTLSRRPKVASGGKPWGPETEENTIWTNRWWLQGWERREEKRNRERERDLLQRGFCAHWFYKTCVWLQFIKM